MKNLKYGLYLFVTGLLLNGCSNKYEVTFDSNPRGATLICNGKNWGYTPKTLYFDEDVRNYSAIDVSRCSANWVSGYSQNYSTSMKIFPNAGTVTTVNRPTGEGYSVDAQFALQVEQMNLQQSQVSILQQQLQEQKNLNNNPYNNNPYYR